MRVEGQARVQTSQGGSRTTLVWVPSLQRPDRLFEAKEAQPEATRAVLQLVPRVDRNGPVEECPSHTQSLATIASFEQI